MLQLRLKLNQPTIRFSEVSRQRESIDAPFSQTLWGKLFG